MTSLTEAETLRLREHAGGTHAPLVRTGMVAAAVAVLVYFLAAPIEIVFIELLRPTVIELAWISEAIADRFRDRGVPLAESRSARALGGRRIEVESAPGHGATFTVFLPLAPTVD